VLLDVLRCTRQGSRTWFLVLAWNPLLAIEGGGKRSTLTLFGAPTVGSVRRCAGGVDGEQLRPVAAWGWRIAVKFLPVVPLAPLLEEGFAFATLRLAAAVVGLPVTRHFLIHLPHSDRLAGYVCAEFPL